MTQMAVPAEQVGPNLGDLHGRNDIECSARLPDSFEVNPPTYMRWAKTIPGVNYAICTPLDRIDKSFHSSMMFVG
jgi:hypothetical protein